MIPEEKRIKKLKFKPPNLSSLHFCLYLPESCQLTLQNSYFFLLLFLCLFCRRPSLCLSETPFQLGKFLERLSYRRDCKTHQRGANGQCSTGNIPCGQRPGLLQEQLLPQLLCPHSTSSVPALSSMKRCVCIFQTKCVLFQQHYLCSLCRL